MSYTLTYSYSNNAYTVTGYTGTPIDVIIPDTYDDGVNGANPVTSIGNSAFTGCSSLTSIAIPDSVTSIGNTAFSYCSSLTSITIGNSVRSIGGYAFYYCSGLTSVTIPDSVTSIGNGVFFNCSSLTSINLIPIIPPTSGNGAFLDISTNAKFYCLSQSENAYKTATNWNTYASKIVADDLRIYFILNANAVKNYFASKQELTNKQDKLAQQTDLTPTTQTLTLTANTRYALGTLTALDITFPSSGNDGDKIIIEFVSGSTATTLTRDTTNAIYNFDSVGSNVFVEFNAQYKVSIGKWVVYSAETTYGV